MKKLKKVFILLITKKKYFANHKCWSACGVSQPDPHFAGQNAGRAKTGQTGSLCHP